MRTINVYEDSAGNWRWSLRASNGRKIAASGEAFDSKSNAKRSARALVKLLAKPVRLEVEGESLH